MSNQYGEKTLKIYLQEITDFYVKITFLEICFEKKTKEYAAVHYKHIHEAFAIFCQQSFEKKIFQKKFVAGCFHLNFTRSFISMFNSKSSSLLQDVKVPYKIYRFQGGFKVVICLGKYTSRLPGQFFSCNQLLRLYALIP